MQLTLNQSLVKPRLIGENILLRACIQSDFEPLKTMRQDPEGCRFIRPVDSEAKTQEIFAQHCDSWRLEEGRWNCLVIQRKDDDTAVGEIVFKLEDWVHQRAEIGYRISGKVAGKGIGSQAVQLIINYLFDELGFFKIVAKCDPRNIASFKVMEKVGMKREAFFRQHFLIGDEWSDQLDYGILRSEWLKS